MTAPSRAGSADVSDPFERARRITTPAAYADPDDVHEVWSWLRANEPVSRIKAPGFAPFWAITKQADILDVERDSELFSNGDRSTVLISEAMEQQVRAITGGSPHLTRSLVNMDGEEHRIYRTLTQAWFMPGSLRKLEARIQEIAKAHVDRMIAGRDACDFVSDVALHYPLHVVMEILGVPESDEPRMLMLTQQLFGARDPELSRSAESLADPSATARMFSAVLEDFGVYFRALTAERRRSPMDDVASVIANALIDGRPISDREAMSYYVLIATAGHDTTSASTAGGIWALAQRPDLLALLQSEPQRIAALVDEAIRWVTPVKHFMRTAKADCEIRGVKIKAGDWLLLSYMSGDRDEEVFEDPFAFRIDRASNKHVAFGFGSHVCLGQHLAKLEMRTFFAELLPRLSSLSLDGQGAWSQSTFVSGPKRLPIRFRAKDLSPAQ